MNRIAAVSLLLLSPLCAQAADAPLPPSSPDAVFVSVTSGVQPVADGVLRGGGEAYRVVLDAVGVRFEPALGAQVAVAQHATLAPHSLGRGDAMSALAPVRPTLVDRTVSRAHGDGVTELLDVRPEGLAIAWRFRDPLPGSGDLVVRYAFSTSLPAPTAARDGGLQFELPGVGGITIGGVTGIDANGARVAGSLRCADGMLEMSLPAAFVATAAYPLLLDPIVSTLAAGSGGIGANDFDLAYDAGTNSWLVVWNVQIAANDSDIRGQRLLNGALWGGLIVFNNTGIAASPRVANLRQRGRFGVIWRQTIAAANTVQLRAVTATTAAVTHSLTVASSTTDAFGQIDIAGEGSLAIGSNTDSLVVYHDRELDAIRTRRVSFNASDNLLAPPAVDLWTDGIPAGAVYALPCVSRCSGADGNVLTTVQRTLAGTASVHCAGVSITGIAAGVVGELPLPTSSNFPFALADVDGADGRWTVFAANPAGITSAVHVNWTSVGLLTFGPPIDPQYGSAVPPRIARSAARTWSLSGIQANVHYDTFDSTSDALGNEVGSPPNSTDTLGAVASTGSGGAPEFDDAVIAYRSPTNQLLVAFLRSHGNGGTIGNLGGGCGVAGTTSFSGNPALGSNGFTCSVSGLSPTALVAVFNFATAGAPFVCGACTFTPWQITLTPPIIGGASSVRFAIPPRANLAGLQFETQWTTIDLAQSLCPLLPGFVTTNRSLLTLGQ